MAGVHALSGTHKTNTGTISSTCYCVELARSCRVSLPTPPTFHFISGQTNANHRLVWLVLKKGCIVKTKILTTTLNKISFIAVLGVLTLLAMSRPTMAQGRSPHGFETSVQNQLLVGHA